MNQMNWASQCLGPAVQNVNLLSWAKSKPNPSEVGQLCQNTKMPRYAEDIHAPKERSIWEENSLSKTSSPSRTLPHARYLNSTTSGPMKRGTTLTTLPIKRFSDLSIGVGLLGSPERSFFFYRFVKAEADYNLTCHQIGIYSNTIYIYIEFPIKRKKKENW